MTTRLEYLGSVETHGAPHVTAWTGIDGLNKIVLDKHVLSLSTHEDINSPSGSFDLELLPRDEFDRGELSIRGDVERASRYLRLLESNTPIAIGVDTYGGIMLGLVGTCDYSTVAVGNNVRVGLKISGQSMGALLEESALSASLVDTDMARWKTEVTAVLGKDAPILKDLLGAEGPVNAAGERGLINMPIVDVATYTLKRIQGMQIPVLAQAFGGRGTVSDVCTPMVSSFEGDRVYKPGLYLSESTAAGFLSEILDKDFYYFRVETIPRAGQIPRLVLVIRPKPFDEEIFRKGPPYWPAFDIDPAASWENMTTLLADPGASWDDAVSQLSNLQYHEIRVEDLAGEFRVGRTAREATNFYTVQNNNELGITQANASAGMSYPIYDLDSAARFKSTRYDSRCSIVPADPKQSSQESTIAASIQARRNRLFCWNRGNPYFLTGSITVRGNDRYRAGDPIWIPWFADPLSNEPGVKFWCTGVSQSWHAGGIYTTTLSLSRGHGPRFWNALLGAIGDRMASIPGAPPYGWTSANR